MQENNIPARISGDSQKDSRSPLVLVPRERENKDAADPWRQRRLGTGAPAEGVIKLLLELARPTEVGGGGGEFYDLVNQREFVNFGSERKQRRRRARALRSFD